MSSLAAGAQPRSAVDTAERAALFLGPLLVFWITLRPLTDLTSDALLSPFESGDLSSQIFFVVIFGLAIAKLMSLGWRRILLLAHPAYLAIVGWLLVSSLLSIEPGISLRRLALSVLVMGLVGMMLLLPRNLRQFSTWVGTAALAVVVLCYLAVLFLPHLAVHQADAVIEADLAGNWRGIYEHKSRAGPMMVIFLFIGLFLLRERRFALGGALALAAGAFLLFTGAKQPIVLVPFVLLLAWVGGRVRRPAVLLVALPGLLLLYNVFLVGSVVFPGIAAIDATLMSDPTFTNRTGIWRFAIDNFLQRPLTGWGFLGFWNTGHTLFNESGGQDAYAAQASHSHNSYLDLALTTGLPGLALALWAIVFLPIRDYARAKADPARASLATLFFQIWAFCVFCGALETIFFRRDDSIWVSFLLAILGLRCLAERRPIA